MLKPSGSSDSWEFPWKKTKRNRPLIVPQNQSGRNVGEVCFLLCFLAVLMLTSSLILIGLSAWSLVNKIVDYRYLLDIKVDIPYFSLPAGFILLPGFWISASIHNNTKRKQFIHLLLIVILIAVILLITGAVIGLMYTIKTDDGDSALSSSLENPDLNKSVSFSFLRYNTSENDRDAWNRIQQRFECCGISNYNDWKVIGLKIPKSCYKDANFTSPQLFQRSCLDSISRDLVFQQNTLKSQCYIMAVILIGKAVISIGVHISNKLAMRREL